MAMPRVVPSQVLAFIDSLPSYEHNGVFSMNHVGSAALAGVIDLVEQIPAELLTMDSASYGQLVLGKAEKKDIIATWEADLSAGHGLVSKQFSLSTSPLNRIRTALTKCPDESPSPGTAELDFIADPDLRANLRIDVGDINRVLANGEWKAATVLAGTASEALLLWALRQHSAADITLAITAARASGNMTANPNPHDLDRWNLHECIEVSAELGVIKPNTAKQARLAKDFQNFIHPGVTQRLGEKCDRATALSAVAGMEHIVRDLTPP